jgi:hypothetical protein
MLIYTVHLYLKTALHVSGGTFTHHQEHIQLYLHHLVFVTPLLLPAAIAAGSSSRPARPRTQHGYHNDTKVKSEAVTAVTELLMMGGKRPKHVEL